MMKQKKIFSAAMAFIWLLGLTAVQGAEQVKIGPSSYPLPRFVSLTKDKVNVRTGPDKKYPIKWVYKAQNLPVKVIAEFGDWRKIVDQEGATGWIWGPLLSLRRYGIIQQDQQPLHRKASPEAALAVRAENGVVGRILACRGTEIHGIWCRMDVGGFKGWLRQKDVWGTLDREIFE